MTLPLVYQFQNDHQSIQVADVTFLQNADVFASMLPLVPVERQHKALMFKHAVGRALSLGAALLLGEMLRPYNLKLRDLSFNIGEHGKPYVAGFPQLHFNLSHTNHYVACAVSDHPVGIDIQHELRSVGEPLMERVLSKEELQWVKKMLGQSSVEVGKHPFFRLWVLKEAWFKCVGTGIVDPFPAFCLEGQRPVLLREDADDFSIEEFSFADCCGAWCEKRPLLMRNDF